MKKALLGVVLGGLLLAVTGCGGGGSGSSSGVKTLYSITVNQGYTVKTSTTVDDTVTMKITNIEVREDKTLKVNCTWTAQNVSGCDQITKYSDAGDAENEGNQFYMYDSSNTKYHHTAGEGAAYTDTVLSANAVTGAYYFGPLSSLNTVITFMDTQYGKTIGPISIGQ